MKKIFLFLISAVLILGGVWWFTSKEKIGYELNLYDLRLGNAKIKVELAQSQGERGQGLGDRNSLPQNQGMLFIFETSDVYPFWMRDMKFPLDIIWLNEDYKVVYIEKNIKPESYPKTFQPLSPAKYVLEVNAGWANANNIKMDSEAVFLWKDGFSASP